MELAIQDAVIVEDPPFENSTPCKVPAMQYFSVTRADGGYVVNVEEIHSIGAGSVKFGGTHVVTTDAKLIKLIKRIIKE